MDVVRANCIVPVQADPTKEADKEFVCPSQHGEADIE